MFIKLYILMSWCCFCQMRQIGAIVLISLTQRQMNVSCKTRTLLLTTKNNSLKQPDQIAVKDLMTLILIIITQIIDEMSHTPLICSTYVQPPTLNQFNVCIATHLESVQCMDSHTPSINSMNGQQQKLMLCSLLKQKPEFMVD